MPDILLKQCSVDMAVKFPEFSVFPNWTISLFLVTPGFAAANVVEKERSLSFLFSI